MVPNRRGGGTNQAWWADFFFVYYIKNNWEGRQFLRLFLENSGQDNKQYATSIAKTLMSKLVFELRMELLIFVRNKSGMW